MPARLRAIPFKGGKCGSSPQGGIRRAYLMSKHKRPKEPTTPEKVGLVNSILNTIPEPWLFLCLLEGRLMNVNVSKNMPAQVFHRMLAQLIVMLAGLNNTTPIKLLADLGEEISELMNNEERRRTAAADKRSPKAGE